MFLYPLEMDVLDPCCVCAEVNAYLADPAAHLETNVSLQVPHVEPQMPLLQISRCNVEPCKKNSGT